MPLASHPEQDTIFAVASGAGRAAVTLLRISGAASGGLLDALCAGGRPPAREARLRALRDVAGGLLDRAVVLWFPGPSSYTGEDSAELHLHGGAAVLAGVVDALAAAGARPAEPGEFTRRAFLNGRMDLIEAEAVADLVEAETAAQRRQALEQLGGGLGALYLGWATRLTGLVARQEALVDFPDEAADEEAGERMAAEIASMEAAVAAHLDDGRRGERLRSGLVFAIAGPPNAGKSTLINALTAREVAIVAPLPGTTRDVLEARIELAGAPVTLLDTAGLRETSEPVEAEGVRRARARLREADLMLWVTEAGQPAPPPPDHAARLIALVSKSDLAAGESPTGGLRISALTGAGMAELRD
ncbi:MAG: tRNA uridine-5-carboxymethylaminomethyl(34) synthesis GTPase MnmE, partial [Rhodospirillales bacterium]|nr:tRNA uridine-5-carboxymethylaminomethyl(34) synthesis GTPase MnmE [Rhodospirillales bacterium]